MMGEFGRQAPLPSGNWIEMTVETTGLRSLSHDRRHSPQGQPLGLVMPPPLSSPIAPFLRLPRLIGMSRALRTCARSSARNLRAYASRGPPLLVRPRSLRGLQQESRGNQNATNDDSFSSGFTAAHLHVGSDSRDRVLALQEIARWEVRVL